jgi:hypothetical protein
MKAVLIQTSDAVEYAPMLEATSRTTSEFCLRHGLEYRPFTGLKCGKFSWHSTYNRIHMMQELLDEGYRGWVLYLDADAYINDLDFPVGEYLKDNQRFAMVAVLASLTAKYWDINAGVVFLNFGHPLGQEIVTELVRRFATAALTPEFAGSDWPDIDLLLDDQGLLNRILIDNPSWEESIRYESDSLMNSIHASFIRHHLRASTPNLVKRVEAIRADVDRILSVSVRERTLS